VIEDRNVIEEYVKKIASGLFGKPSLYVVEKKKAPVRPIGMIVEDLCQIDEPDWAKYAFSRDPLCSKFDEKMNRELMQQALDCGVSAAEECITAHGTKDPIEIAGQLKLKVRYPMIPQGAGRILFAEYREPDEINIFMDAINRAERLLKEPGVEPALTKGLNIQNLLIAHELFHFVEQRQKKEIWTKTYKIELWGIGPLRYRSTIAALSEIAAMGFCKKLTELPYSPYVMDAFLMYGYTAESASVLYEEMMTMAGKTPRLPDAQEDSQDDESEDI